MQKFFETWSSLVVRRRWLVLLCLLSLNAVFGYAAATKLVVNTSTEALLSEESKAAVTLKRLRKLFGDDRIFQVTVEGDVFSERYLERLAAFHRDLETIDLTLVTGEVVTTDRATGEDEWGDEAGGSSIEQVLSLINVRQLDPRDGGLHVHELLDPMPAPGALPELRAKVLDDPGKVGLVIGARGEHSVVILRTAELTENELSVIYDEVRRRAEVHRAEGFDIMVGGYPSMLASLNELLVSDTERVFGIALLAMLLILVLIFRQVSGVLGPIAVILTACAWTYGTMALLGVKVTMVSNTIPLFILAVGLGDSIHVQSIYRDLRREGCEKGQAIVTAIGRTGPAILFTTLTTALGLLSFRTSSLASIREMGTFSAVGAVYALALSLTLLPIVLSFHRKGRFGLRSRASGDLIGRLLAMTRGLSGGGARPRSRAAGVVIASVVLTGIAAVGVSRLQVFHEPLSWYPPEHELVQAFETQDANVGGTANMALLVSTKEGHRISDHEVLERMQILENRIEKYRASEGEMAPVTHVSSVLDLLREGWQATHGGEEGEYRLPPTQQAVTDMFTLMENGRGQDYLARYVDTTRRHGTLVVRLNWQDATAYQPLGEFVEVTAREVMGDVAEVSATGSVFADLSVIGNLVRDLVSSFSVALAAITLMMLLVMRSVKLALLAMAPNLLPIIWVMGFMGFAGIPIDLVTMLIAAIALGIVVDDTIHMFYHFKIGLSRRLGTEGAIDYALSEAGRALVVTTVVVMTTFLMYLLADMENLRRFGTLIAATVAAALVADLVLAPAALRLVYGREMLPSDTTTSPGDESTTGREPEPEGSMSS